MAGIIDVLVYLKKSCCGCNMGHRCPVTSRTYFCEYFQKGTKEQRVCTLQKLPEGTKYNHIKWHNCASHSFKTTTLVYIHVYNEMSRFVPHLCEQTHLLKKSALSC